MVCKLLEDAYEVKKMIEIVLKGITQKTFIYPCNLKLSPISTSSLISWGGRKEGINASTASSVIWH